MATIKRGDVVLVDFPFIQDLSKTKLRPALVIQNDIGNRFGSNTIVLPISATIPSKSYPTHYKITTSSTFRKKAGLITRIRSFRPKRQ